MQPWTNPLCVALDTADRSRFAALLDLVGPVAGVLKIGLEATYALGSEIVEEASEHAPVFWDLKLHDIPNTVAGAARAAQQRGVSLLTLHAGGGPEMIQAGVEAAPDVTVLAVTVLTSLDTERLNAFGLPPADELVPLWARTATEAGAAGVVCAAPEIAAVRDVVGPEAVIVVPGIRPDGVPRGDQARVATPAAALAAGADLIVVGRAITTASDPLGASEEILSSIP